VLPIPNLDDKTFAQLADEAVKTIPRLAPQWTDHNLHDPGMTMLDLFAWLTEMQQFYMDQIRPDSERNYLKLLGVRPHDASPARTEVTFGLPLGAASPVIVPKGTKLAAEDLVFETERDLTVVPAELARIVSAHAGGVIDHTDANRRGGLYYAAFGSNAELGSRLYIGFDAPLPAGVEISLTFQLADGEGAHAAILSGQDLADFVPSATVSWEYWSSDEEDGWMVLPLIQDETAMLSRSGALRFKAPTSLSRRTLPGISELACYWLRAVVTVPGYEMPPRVDAIMLHTVGAVQLDTLSETLGRGSGLPWQTFRLDRFTALPDSLELDIIETPPEGGDAQPVRWTRVDSLDGSGREDRHYTFDADTGIITFGDGITGRLPEVPIGKEENIVLRAYAVTEGDRGNVPAGSISGFVQPSSELAGVTVVNRKPAIGGAAAETLSAAKSRARSELSAVQRAVTSEDYETLALSTPGLRVARAKAVPLQGEDGRVAEGRVTVVIVPLSEYPNPRPSEGFLRTVCRHLDRHRLLGTELRVLPPNYVKIAVEAEVSVRQGYGTDTTEAKAAEALNQFLHPLAGGPEGRGWPFGRTVYVSEIYEVLEGVAGVDAVANVRLLASEGSFSMAEDGSLAISPFGLVYSDRHQVTAVSGETGCAGQGGYYDSVR